MTDRSWSTREFRRFPEMRHFDAADPLMRRWTGMFSVGWWARGVASVLCAAAWTGVCAALGWLMLSLLWRHEVVGFFALMSLSVVWLIGLWAAGAFGEFLVHRRALRSLRSELRRRGIPICIACGYEGGTIDIPQCPECGAAHTPVA